MAGQYVAGDDGLCLCSRINFSEMRGGEQKQGNHEDEEVYEST
jgi:hypothetical protein